MWHGSCSVWHEPLVAAAPPAADAIGGGTAARNATCIYMYSITGTAMDLSLQRQVAPGDPAPRAPAEAIPRSSAPSSCMGYRAVSTYDPRRQKHLIR